MPVQKSVVIDKATFSYSSEHVNVSFSRDETKVVEKEQLAELSKPHSLFLTCERDELTGDHVSLTYRVPESYFLLKEWHQAPDSVKQRISLALLAVRNTAGTQFTTYLHPANVFATKTGEVKFAHRGIRSVLPPEKIEGKAFVFQMKCLVLSFLSGHPYEGLLKKGVAAYSYDHSPISMEVRKVKSLHQLEEVLKRSYKQKVGTEKKVSNTHVKNPSQKKNNIVPPAPVTPNKSSPPEEKRTDEKEKRVSGLPLIPLLGAMAIGIIIGAVGNYSLQSRPNAEIATNVIDENQQMEQDSNEQVSELEEQLVRNERLLASYQLMGQGNNEEAIASFEAAEDLSETDIEVLASLYLSLDTPEDVVMAYELDSTLARPVATQLVSQNTEEANEALLGMESHSPPILIEQAWLENDYDTVLILQEEELREDDRAQSLAVNAHLANGDFNEALSLAESVDSTSLQISVIEAQIAELENDEDREEAIESLLEQIEALEE
ncbi:type VII secretion protein EssB/YukC [Salipaludibacillus daqingensis]|uniref:type VII secretion protein EssB/YukC n=1 Tax=Salipaludibacillus daqingensis TaxID=3041001 RepID=UPI00247681D7|nr:type VII secretion protein EssB/YukC [Salipaludibacillus daqingensis]